MNASKWFLVCLAVFSLLLSVGCGAAAIPSPTASLTVPPSATPLPSATATEVPTLTPTPTLTETPTPTPTPDAEGLAREFGLREDREYVVEAHKGMDWEEYLYVVDTFTGLRLLKQEEGVWRALDRYGKTDGMEMINGLLQQQKADFISPDIKKASTGKWIGLRPLLMGNYRVKAFEFEQTARAAVELEEYEAVVVMNGQVVWLWYAPAFVGQEGKVDVSHNCYLDRGGELIHRGYEYEDPAAWRSEWGPGT